MTAIKLRKVIPSVFLMLIPAFLAVVLFPAWSLGDEPGVKVVHALAMSGTPKYPAGFTHFDYVNPDAPKGGTLKMGTTGTYDSFNPFITKGVPASGVGFLYDTLTVKSDDEPFTQYGLVADQIELPDDLSWVVYHIDPQARFSDGTPITAEDVVFSFEILTTQGDPQYRKYYADIEKVEALDERRVKFYLGKETNPELALIIGQLSVMPKHYWQDRDFARSTLDIPVGSGPYTIADFKPGRSVTYKLRDDYWAKDHPVNKGQYNFQYITIDYYRDATVSLTAFKAGEYDFRQEYTSKDWATAYTGPPFDAGLIIKEEIENDVNQGMQCFVFNTRRPIFQDRRVREAIGYAFDFEWTNKNLFYGQYQRAKSFFSNSELASSGLPSPGELAVLEPLREQLPPEVFSKEYTPPETDGSGNVRRNLRTAMKLLKEAGWVIKNGKLTNAKTGEIFKFEIMLIQPAFERVVAPFQKNLARLGIEVTYRAVDTAQYINRLNEYDFDMITMRFMQSESPGNEQRYYWGSAAADLPGTRNYVAIKDPAIDALIEKVISAPDRKALVTRTRALDRALLWGHYVIPQWYTSYYRVAYWDKFSRPKITPKYDLALYSWWVDPEKDRRVQEYRNRLKSSGS